MQTLHKDVILNLAGSVGLAIVLNIRSFPAMAEHAIDDIEKLQIQRCTQSILKSPGDANLYLKRAGAYYGNAEYGLADEDYTKAIQMGLITDTIYLQRALCRAGLGRNGEALADIDRALKLRPNSDRALSQKAAVYVAMKKDDLAILQYSEILKKHPSPQALMERAALLRKNGKLIESLHDLDEAVRLRATSVELLHRRASLLLEMKRYKDAAADYTSAILLNDENAGDYKNRADARLLAGDLNGALDDYNRLLKEEATFSGAYYGRARVYDKLGERAKADADRKRAHELEN
jgi:tetratricopeptide (TPR) repeat protein